MPKAERGSAKDIANRMKAKGLQKLKFYCQMCNKQCRDENGFQCHLTSDSHLRQMKIFSDNASGMLDQFSREFEVAYVETLRRRHGTKRVNANSLYQEVIQDKHHVHMNSTKWITLSDFVQYLGKTGKCVVEETERGWYVQYVQRDPAILARQEAHQRRIEAEKKEEERYAKRMEIKRIEAAKMLDRVGGVVNLEATNLERVKDENGEDKTFVATINISALPENKKKKKISLKRSVLDVEDNDSDDKEDGETNIQNNSQIESASTETNLKKDDKIKKRSRWGPIEETETTRPNLISGLPKATSLTENVSGKYQYTVENERHKKERNEKNSDLSDVRKDNWIRKEIIVRIIAKKSKYFKRKAFILKVIEKYTAKVEILDSGPGERDGGEKVKFDQEDLETVIPSEGKKVLILNGPGRGLTARLLETNKKKYRGKLKILENGFILEKVDFENFSKLAT